VVDQIAKVGTGWVESEVGGKEVVRVVESIGSVTAGPLPEFFSADAAEHVAVRNIIE